MRIGVEKRTLLVHRNAIWVPWILSRFRFMHEFQLLGVCTGIAGDTFNLCTRINFF